MTQRIVQIWINLFKVKYRITPKYLKLRLKLISKQLKDCGNIVMLDFLIMLLKQMIGLDCMLLSQSLSRSLLNLLNSWFLKDFKIPILLIKSIIGTTWKMMGKKAFILLMELSFELPKSRQKDFKMVLSGLIIVLWNLYIKSYCLWTFWTT